MPRSLLLIFLLAVVPAAAADSAPKDSLHLPEMPLHDPWILAHEPSQTYYLYTSNVPRMSGVKGVGTMVYKSKDLRNWESPKVVFLVPPTAFAQQGAWAPEVHEYKGRYYLFTTLHNKEKPLATPPDVPFPTHVRGTITAVSDSPDGPFKMLDEKASVPPADFMTLDGTLYVDRAGKPWMVYAHEWVQKIDGTMEAVPLKPDLSAADGPPIHLFKASDAPWLNASITPDTRDLHYVSDGPELFRTRDGHLLMLWSSYENDSYVQTVARSKSGELNGPWEQLKPLVKGDSGHGMLFRTFEGQLMMVLHRPFKTARGKLYEMADRGDHLEVVKERADLDGDDASTLAGRAPHAANPILPGYYADPSLLQFDGKIYIYATLDPWGDKTLGCWESSDWKNWTYRELNWPTKAACTSPSSRVGMVWAPSVLRGTDGKFHMVLSVGNEVWAGVADHPLGPWRNALGDRPLIPGNYQPGFHMIDAELFLDDDGQAYLYWGSGLEWTNGKCWAVKLKPDMATFDGDVREITPGHYFEAPFMVKHGGHYFLMYSAGKTTEDTYQVRYAVGDTPFGPFKEAPNSPVLKTDASKGIISPGHHAVFTKGGESFILYHRQSLPFDPKFIGRQVCVDRLIFTKEGLIEKVVPTHTGPDFVQRRPNEPLAATATASSKGGSFLSPTNVLDDNYATRWAPARDDTGAWLQLDFGKSQKIARQEVRPEYAWKPYHFIVQFSDDGHEWQTLEDFMTTPAIGSPIVVAKPVTARYLRLLFSSKMKASDISLFEWRAEETAN